MKPITFTLITVVALMVNTLYAQVSFEPPYSLEASINGNDVLLNWSPPDTANSQYLSWDAGITGNSIGLTDSGSFAVAARWDPALLEDFQGYSISKLAFYMPGLLTDYTAFIWQGPNADSVSFSTPVEQVQPGTWTYVYPDTPVPFDALQDLWAGYEVSQLGPDFGAGTDFGPAVAGYGDMLNYDGTWISMFSVLGLDFNFNVRVYLTDGQNESLVLMNGITASAFPYAGSKAFEAAGSPLPVLADGSKMVSTLQGYNVYRDNQLITPTPLTDTLLVDPSLDNGVYTYGVTAVYEDGESSPVSTTAQIGNPEMVIFPESIADTILPGTYYEKILTIYNEGDADLYWSAITTDPLIFVSPPAGLLAPGEGFDLVVYIYTFNLTAGEYNEQIIFTQNNEQNPVIEVPVNLTVIGSPGIAVSPASLSFGDVVFGNTYSYDLTVSNIGTDSLVISEIISSNPVFQTGAYETSLAPYEQTSISVSFTPEELGEVEGSLTIFSNDVINPELVVPLSAFAYLQPPVLLQASVENTDVTLQWEEAITGSGEWLNYDNGENFTGLGITEGGSFQYAIRWDASQLLSYANMLVPKIAFFPRGANTSYTLKVWQGANATQELLSQEITSFFPDQWNEVFLQMPFAIDGTEELWLGFEVNHPTGDYPAGADMGPAVSGYGDMLNLEGSWVSMLEFYGIDYNWNLQMFVLTEDSAAQYAKVPPPKQATKKFFNKGSITDGNLPTTDNPVFAAMTDGAELLGYNVYRDGLQLNGSLIEETTYTDFALDFGIYAYGVSAVYDLGESPQAQLNVQVGAPDMVFSPESISDTLLSGENKDYVVTISNAGNFVLDWNAQSPVSWLTISESNGTIGPGESTEVLVNLNSAALFSGLYVSNLVFEINNLNQPLINFPVEMIVEGEAQLTVTPDTIDFGVTPLGTFKTSYVTITNTGNDFIYITEMAASPAVFTTQSFPVYLFPGGTIALGIYFTPDSLGTFDGTFTVFTDDPNYPAVQTSLTGSSLLPEPMNLSGTIDSLDVLLDWQSPYGSGSNYLQYADDFSANALGYPEGGTFMVAAKFGPEELLMYNGSALTQLGFIPWSADASFTLKVWLGENADSLVLAQPVSGLLPLEWNDFSLDFPIPLDAVETIWIGYEVAHEPGDFPAGTDFGPAVPGKGDLISTDGINWETLSYYGLPFNWSIRGYVDLDNESVSGAGFSLVPPAEFNNTGQIKAAVSTAPPAYKASAASFTLLGYKVYRNGTLLNDSILISNSEYLDPDLTPGIYTYEVTAQYDIGESLPVGPLDIVVEEPVSAPEGWEHHHTAMSHVIHIPTQAAGESSFMSPGDWIGVFYDDNGLLRSGGSGMWKAADSLVLIVYGDDPSTSEKEGFVSGEWLYWKVYMNESGEEFSVDVDYNPMMPHFDGLFHMFGMSALNSIQLMTTGTDELTKDRIQVFPNPSSGRFTISGIGSIESVRIVNAMGMQVFSQVTGGFDQLVISDNFVPGIYSVLLEDGDRLITKKIIVR